MRAIVRPPSPAIADCALTYLERRPIDVGSAVAQHTAYVEVLRRAGVDVQGLPPDPSLPDAVFVEDTAVVVEECAVIARPGVDSRLAEVDAVALALAAFRPIVRVTPPGTLEGGDVLRVGRVCFLGQTPRTNAEGTRQLERALAPHGYDVVPVTPTGCLHLKSAVTFIGDGTVLVNPAWIDVDLFSRWQCVPVAPEEPFAANTLLVAGTVHLAASAPLTRRKLDALGFTTSAIDTSELEKAEAGLTCLSLLFE